MKTFATLSRTFPRLKGTEAGDIAKTIWRTLRTLVGDDAYERYCVHLRRNHPEQIPLDRRAYYVKRQTEKWSGVKRCC